jgi:hypothetical protein
MYLLSVEVDEEEEPEPPAGPSPPPSEVSPQPGGEPSPPPEEGDETDGNILLWVVIGAVVLGGAVTAVLLLRKKVLLLLCAVMALTLLAGCEPGVKMVVISKPPDKLIYIAGQDTELDLTGGELIEHSNAIPFFPSSAREGTMDSLHLGIHLNHEIDFNTPGVYLVIINVGRANVADTFEIQVVTQEEYDAMKATEQSD